MVDADRLSDLNRERQSRWRARRRAGKVMPRLVLNAAGQEALIDAGYLKAELRQDKDAVGRAIIRALEDALR